jgi:hypothetical protein
LEPALRSALAIDTTQLQIIRFMVVMKWFIIDSIHQ